MFLTVRNDLFHFNQSQINAQNIQENAEITVNSKKEKREGLKDISNEQYRVTPLIKQGSKSKTTLTNEKENFGDIRYSNDMRDACKTTCQICKAAVFLTTLRGHTRNTHKVPIEEYKKVYGNHRNNIIEKVFHKCGICLKTVLLDSDEMSHHLKKNHSISHKNYNADYMVTRKKTEQTSSKSKIRKEDPTPHMPYPTPNSSNQEKTTKQKVFPEKSYPISNEQKVQSIEEEDYKSMSTEEILRAIDLVLNSQFS